MAHPLGPTARHPPTRVCREDARLTAEAVAGYLAKYATKAVEPSGLPVTGRMTEAIAEYYSNPDTHLGRLIAFAWQLGTLPEYGRPSSSEGLARHLGPAAPLDPHARIRRPLRHQEPPLLHDPQALRADRPYRRARISRRGDAATSSTATPTTTRRP